jgi:hypothetical protein
MTIKNKRQLADAADRYMTVATKRFAKRTKREPEGEDAFVNGFSWGANQGYIAGFKAATRKRTSSRR